MGRRRKLLRERAAGRTTVFPMNGPDLRERANWNDKADIARRHAIAQAYQIDTSE